MPNLSQSELDKIHFLIKLVDERAVRPLKKNHQSISAWRENLQQELNTGYLSKFFKSQDPSLRFLRYVLEIVNYVETHQISVSSIFPLAEEWVLAWFHSNKFQEGIAFVWQERFHVFEQTQQPGKLTFFQCLYAASGENGLIQFFAAVSCLPTQEFKAPLCVFLKGQPFRVWRDLWTLSLSEPTAQAFQFLENCFNQDTLCLFNDGIVETILCCSLSLEELSQEEIQNAVILLSRTRLSLMMHHRLSDLIKVLSQEGNLPHVLRESYVSLMGEELSQLQYQGACSNFT